VSGGVDSIVMANLFRKNAQSRFAIAHCNFHLRGPESDGDAEFVQAWAERNGVKFFVKDFDTVSYAEEHHISIEMAARDLRYAWFDELCRSHGFAGTCVAHNANDNAETLILNLVRGTGIKGLCAMAETAKNPCGDTLVFRPMLHYSRADIEEYAVKNGIAFRTDSTNASSDYKRNLIRNEVFPLLQKLNPSLITTLNSDICHFVQLSHALDFCLLRPKVVDGKIDIAAMKSVPDWKLGLYLELSEKYSFNSDTVDDLVQLLESDGIIGGRQFFSPECRLVTTTTHLVLLPLERDKAGYKIELIHWRAGMSPICPRGVSLIDASSVKGEPVLRPWREGDYLCPIGLHGKKKVSDILTDLKYNLSEKEDVLVVEGSGSHVLAVVGERVDESAAITSSTLKAYRISRQ